MEPIKVEFQHTKESLKHSIMQVYQAGPRKGLKWIGYFLIFMAVATAIMNMTSQFGNGELGSSFFMMILGLYFTFNSNVVAFFTVKRLKPNDQLYEVILYTFDEEGFEIKGDSFSSEQTWDKINQVVEKEDCLLLFIRKNMAHYIPKEAFKNSDFEKLKSMFINLSYLKTKLL